MSSKSRPLDDVSNLLTNAFGAVKGVGDEVKAVGRSQAERIIADMDLVGRDEFEVLKARLLTSHREIEALTKKVKTLEGQVRKLKTNSLTVNTKCGF